MAKNFTFNITRVDPEGYEGIYEEGSEENNG